MRSFLIGIVSDTHGLLRPQAVAALRGVDRILHAGDIGKPEIIEELAAIAPVTAVRGNNDTGDWAAMLSDRESVDIGGIAIYMIHDRKQLDHVPKGFDMVIAGHSHKPSIEEGDGMIFLNPGSIGPRRFRLPVTLAHLTIKGGKIFPKIIELAV